MDEKDLLIEMLKKQNEIMLNGFHVLKNIIGSGDPEGAPTVYSVLQAVSQYADSILDMVNPQK
jgi:hypothetical protein